MGGSKSKAAPTAAKLPEELEQKLTEFFKKMDTDNSGSVDKDEAAAFWGKNFAKVRPAPSHGFHEAPHVELPMTRTHARSSGSAAKAAPTFFLTALLLTPPLSDCKM